ncbi:MAG TPA: hypothetical protein VHU91_02710 [Mycobacteriales bacterium]|jgi:hypothetical protein|nr:hypothetical protein [Mycobacteriales bacterium]
MSVSPNDGYGRTPGLGIVSRWLLAAPLLALSLVGMPLGLLATHSWSERESGVAYREVISTWRTHSFHYQFGHDLTLFLPVYGSIVAIVVIVLAVNWLRITRWSYIAPIPTLLIALSTSIVAPLGADRLDGWRRTLAGWPWLVGLAAVAISWLLARLAVATLTSHQTGETAGSHLEVPIPLTSGEDVQLFVGRTELTLLGLPATPNRLTVALRDVALLQAGKMQVGSTWTLPNETCLELPVGDAVRIVTADQQWVLGVEDAATTVRLVRARMQLLGKENKTTVPVSQKQWSAAHSRFQTDQKRLNRRSRYGWAYSGRNAGLLVGLICAALTVLTLIPIGYHWRPVNLLGTAFYGGVAAAAFWLYQTNRRAYRTMERHPRPPAADSWGNTTESAAPVTGWSSFTVV